MDKHTSAPWTVLIPDGSPIPYIGSDTGMVAALFGKSGEEKANAPLIAASPELLAILDELEGSFDQQTYQEKSREEFDAPDDREYSVNITAKQLRAISRVILKATSPEAAP